MIRGVAQSGQEFEGEDEFMSRIVCGVFAAHNGKEDAHCHLRDPPLA
jgi:hypothetical protein